MIERKGEIPDLDFGDAVGQEPASMPDAAIANSDGSWTLPTGDGDWTIYDTGAGWAAVHPDGGWDDLWSTPDAAAAFALGNPDPGTRVWSAR